MRTRKILYISGTRADYGLMRETLFAIQKHPKLNLEIAVTGMHLMPEFGKTINEIKKDGFKIHRVEAIYRKDIKESMTNFIGECTLKLTKAIKQIRPDIILLLGDRAEMLVGAIVGVYLTIPVVHIHGGEVTSTVDELARQAITKLSHIHFPATKKSAQRIIKIGEDSWRVHTVGAPGLDSILKEKLISPKEIAKKYKLNLSKPILLVLQHPVTTEVKDASWQIREIMEAIRESGYQTIVVYPNADPGGRAIIKVIEKYRKYPFIQIYKNIPREDYLGLMKVVKVIMGNSSGGIIESPSIHLPAINIGKRQMRRERATNVINVNYKKEEIKKAIQKAIYDKRFREKVKKCKNPYGDGKTGMRIANILSRIKINQKLLEKQITY